MIKLRISYFNKNIESVSINVFHAKNYVQKNIQKIKDFRDAKTYK